jgi:hypothetical protein
VRRRCRYIIIGDAEQDQNLTFGSLGAAIRKCRADFGVEIDIDPNPIRLGTNRFSKAHCVVGTISYPEAETGAPVSLSGDPARPSDNTARGWILYLKSSLTGDEPADVISTVAVRRLPASEHGRPVLLESQFESYRRLGLRLARRLRGCPATLATGTDRAHCRVSGADPEVVCTGVGLRRRRQSVERRVFPLIACRREGRARGPCAGLLAGVPEDRAGPSRP